MARELTRVIGELRTRITELARQRDAAQSVAERNSQEATRLRMDLEECRRELKEARMEIDFLTVSHRLADSPENLISARRRLQRMIYKIDRCVTLLREDADIS